MKNLIAAFVVMLMALPSHAGWSKTVTKNGKTTVTGDPETMAAMEKKNQEKAAYEKDIAEAPRRQPSDPIRVLVLLPYNSPDEKKTFGGMNDALVKDLKKDPLFNIEKVEMMLKNEAGDINSLVTAAGQKGKSGDVYVVARLGTEAALGKNKATGKVVAMEALAYKAEVASAYKQGVTEQKELGTIFQNVEMTQKLAQKVRGTIKNEIGPTLPSTQAVAEIKQKHMQSSLASQTGIQPGDDLKTKLNKLFKPKNQVN